MKDSLAAAPPVDDTAPAAEHQLDVLLAAPIAAPPARPARIEGVRTGTLVGFTTDGTMPLVTYADQPTSAAQAARTTLDLTGAQVGRSMVMLFDGGDPHHPIIVGCLRAPEETPLAASPGHVEIEADGERLVVSARDRIILRCGKASITLTKEGKITIQGAYVSNQSSGVLRLKGGSVQIN